VPQFVHSFNGFEKYETYHEIADIIVNLAEQLEVNVADVEELV
jgi:hypothetical protein